MHGYGLFLNGDNVLIEAAIHNSNNMGLEDKPGDIVVATTVANAAARGVGLRAASPPTMNVLMNSAIVNNAGGLTTDADDGEYRFIDTAVADNASASFTDINTDNNNTSIIFNGLLLVTDLQTSCDANDTNVGIDDDCVPQFPAPTGTARRAKSLSCETPTSALATLWATKTVCANPTKPASSPETSAPTKDTETWSPPAPSAPGLQSKT